MKNFLKENWFKISIVIILLFLVLAIIYYFIFFIPAQQKKAIYIGSLDYQAKCSSQAEKALGIFMKDDTMDYFGLKHGSFAQENHYNEKMNKCFVLISYSPIYSPNYSFNINSPLTQPTNYEDLVDAYENTNLAHCTIFGNDIITKDAKVNQICWTADNGKTFEDYKNFVLQRMEMPDPYK